MSDWRYGVECEIRMRCDSSAARGIFLRCCSRYSLCTASIFLTVLSESTVMSPHLPTSAVLHSDRQDRYGCFCSRIESVCHQNISLVFLFFVFFFCFFSFCFLSWVFCFKLLLSFFLPSCFSFFPLFLFSCFC